MTLFCATCQHLCAYSGTARTLTRAHVERTLCFIDCVYYMYGLAELDPALVFVLNPAAETDAVLQLPEVGAVQNLVAGESDICTQPHCGCGILYSSGMHCVVFNNALCCTLTMPFQYTSPLLTIGATPQQSVSNLIAWLHTILLVAPVVCSRFHDRSLSTIYEGIPEVKFQTTMNQLLTAQTHALFVACKNANVSAGWCWSIHSNRGVVKAYHLCVGSFASNTG